MTAPLLGSGTENHRRNAHALAAIRHRHDTKAVKREQSSDHLPHYIALVNDQYALDSLCYASLPLAGLLLLTSL